MLPDFGDPRITLAVQALIDTLAEKGRDYRNAALEPVQIASSLSPEQRIRSRIDEKLARLKAWPNHHDTILDLAGCFILLLAAQQDGNDTASPRTRPDLVHCAPVGTRSVGDGPRTIGGARSGALLYSGE